ncbi:MAG: transketolase [Pseudomonadota bacterium]
MPSTKNALASTELLKEIEQKVLWLASWTIHNANKRSTEEDDVKVGGHQASSASLVSIMTALYFSELRPNDRVAVKPHASPVFHAIQYLAGNQSEEKLQNFRGLGGAQSYPSRTKDVDDVDFSTGSVGLGVAQTLFSSLVQDYVAAHGWMSDDDKGRMIALIGDAEMDEGNIYEALIEGWKQGLKNCWWIVDYNRQSLDAVIREGLWEKFEAMFQNFGWRVITLRHGRRQQAAFAKPGGEALREWIIACPNQLYSALTFQGGAAWRQRFETDFKDNPDVLSLIASYTDDALSALMANLGGHDLDLLQETFASAADSDRPTLFLCYTIKGYGLPLAGHKDNHAGLMTETQISTLKTSLNIDNGEEWSKWAGCARNATELQAAVDAAPFFQQFPRRRAGAKIPVADHLDYPKPSDKLISTQMAFGQILHEISKTDSALSNRIVTTSPDVTVSTNLGPWVNRKGLFNLEAKADTFKAEKIPSTYNWTVSPNGQHIELGIAESNLFIALSALGLSHSINGERLLPIGTVYDPFIYRAADQLNYACYQDARFMLVATPSGVTLAPEGGAHQSIGTPLIGLAQDRLASFEPAFADELATIMRFGFDYMQREDEDGAAEPQEAPTSHDNNYLHDERGGSIYLRLSTRPLSQPKRLLSERLQEDILNGAYWLRAPGPNTELVVAYAGVTAPEALKAVGLLSEAYRDIALLAVTSADRLYQGWTAAAQAREAGEFSARSHIDRLLSGLSKHTGLVTVLDGHPATLGWLGSVHGQPTRALGVTQFGQTGTIRDLYGVHGIDAKSIIAAARSLAPGRTVSYLRA